LVRFKTLDPLDLLHMENGIVPGVLPERDELGIGQKLTLRVL
jgi:hypothetical protein